MSSEIDYLLRMNIEGVDVYDDEASIAARISEWLNTPRGQIWGAPQWGNDLAQFKHEPVTPRTSAAIEASILLSLPNDVNDVAIQGITVESNLNGIDTYKITIIVNNIVINQGLNLE